MAHGHRIRCCSTQDSQAVDRECQTSRRLWKESCLWIYSEILEEPCNQDPDLLKKQTIRVCD